MWKTRGERGSSCSLQRESLQKRSPPAFAEKSAREASGGNSRWESCCRVGEEPVELTSAASPHVPDTLPNALPRPHTGTRQGRADCAHFTDPTTEAHGGGASNLSYAAGEGRAGM